MTPVSAIPGGTGVASGDPGDALIDVLTHVSSARLGSLAIDPGFAAIVKSDMVGEVLRQVLAIGGDVTAAVAAGRLVGYVTIAPFEPIQWAGRTYHRRWECLPGGRELGSIEVSRAWRGRRLGERLVLATVADGSLDRTIVVSEELSWHWDDEELGLTKREYRAMLQRLLAKAGFREYKTDEPNIRSDPYNMLMARIGPLVPEDERARFMSLLFTGEGGA